MLIDINSRKQVLVNLQLSVERSPLTSPTRHLEFCRQTSNMDTEFQKAFAVAHPELCPERLQEHRAHTEPSYVRSIGYSAMSSEPSFDDLCMFLSVGELSTAAVWSKAGASIVSTSFFTSSKLKCFIPKHSRIHHKLRLKSAHTGRKLGEKRRTDSI